MDPLRQSIDPLHLESSASLASAITYG